MPTIERDGVELYFSDTGSGPALFFHTGGGGDGRMWELAGYTEQLRGKRHLLFDHRGHGRSGCPDGLEAHRVDNYVADVFAVLEAVGVDRAVLIGYSAGADVVFRVAAEAPSRCSAIIAIGGPPQPFDLSEWNRALAGHLRAVGMRSLMEEFSAGEPEPAPAWLIDNLASTDTEMFALSLEAWADAPKVWDFLPRIAAPSLLVVGELEQGEPGAVDEAVQRLPRGHAVVSPGFAHLQNFWHAEVTAPLISAFLETVLRES